MNVPPSCLDTCVQCGQRCCRYVVHELPTPGADDRDLWEYFRELVSQPANWLYVDDEGLWHVQIDTHCSALGEDGRCTIYEQRPTVCADYDVSNCEYTGSMKLRLVFNDEPSLRRHIETVRLRARRQLAKGVWEAQPPLRGAPALDGESLVIIDSPRCREDFDAIRWMLLHHGVWVFRCRGVWYFQFCHPNVPPSGGKELRTERQRARGIRAVYPATDLILRTPADLAGYLARRFGGRGSAVARKKAGKNLSGPLKPGTLGAERHPASNQER